MGVPGRSGRTYPESITSAHPEPVEGRGREFQAAWPVIRALLPPENQTHERVDQVRVEGLEAEGFWDQAGRKGNVQRVVENHVEEKVRAEADQQCRLQRLSGAESQERDRRECRAHLEAKQDDGQ